MSDYSIKDLEHLSGIKAHTLRIWEQRYDIIRPKRTEANIRTYDDQDLKLVLNISLLKDHGYKISEVARMSRDAMHQEVINISEKQLTYPDQIHALTLSMLDLDEDRFEKIINTNILQFGFENLMVNIVYPFLGRIGTLWMTGSIGPAQEHFITNLIRQKVIVAIDGQLSRLRPDAKKFLLFLPEGELHELSLLFANYLIRARQHQVIYLGQSLPFSELVFAYNVHQPEYIFTAITTVPGPDEVQAYVYRLAQQFPASQLLLTGYQVIGQDLNAPDNVQFVNNVRELVEIASV